MRITLEKLQTALDKAGFFIDKAIRVKHKHNEAVEYLSDLEDLEVATINLYQALKDIIET